MTACPNPPADADRLLAEAEPLIRWHIRNARVPSADRPDVAQDIRVRLWRAAKKWDPSKPQPFKCFAQAVIRTGLAEYHSPRGWRLAPLVFTELEDLGRNPAPADDEPDDEDEDAAELSPADDALLDRIAGRLTPTQAAVFKLVAIDGLTVAQASEQLGYVGSKRSHIIRGTLPGIVAAVADLLPPEALAALRRWQAAEPAKEPGKLTVVQRRRLEHLLAGGVLAGSDFGRGDSSSIRASLDAIERRLAALGELTPDAAAALARGRAELDATDAADVGGPTFGGISLTVISKQRRILFAAVMAGRTLAEVAGSDEGRLTRAVASAASLEKVLRRRGRWTAEIAAAFKSAALTPA